jgi:hypothetical protein
MMKHIKVKLLGDGHPCNVCNKPTKGKEAHIIIWKNGGVNYYCTACMDNQADNPNWDISQQDLHITMD